MARTLTSTASSAVKAVRALHSPRGRRASGTFLAEGPAAVRAALAAGVAAEVFATAQAAAEHRLEGATLVSEEVARAMAETATPQGLLAVCPVPVPDLRAAVTGARSIVVLEAVADPGNLGTIIRTADAAGAGAVVCTPGSADPWGGKVVRSSAGSLFHLPVLRDVALADVLALCRERGLPSVGATADGADPVAAVSAPVAWVFGTEAHGLSPQARAAVDRTAYIPMPGRAESLNVAIAVAVCLFAHVADTPAR